MAPPKTPKPIIVLFEDEAKTRKKHRDQIAKTLPHSVKVISFEDQDPPAEGPVEAHLFDLLKSERYDHGNIGLIVCDRDLTSFAKANPQSDRVVSEVAEQLGVPICIYEAGDADAGTTGLLSLKTSGRWKRTEIFVDSLDDKKFGQVCAGLYQGFEEIRTAISNINDFAKMTPPEILAGILGKKEEVDRIALYGAGEQDALQELLPYYEQSSFDISVIRRRYHRVIGNWLFSSILRFPGILVNEVAAASYLGIAVKDFKNKDVQKLFEGAAYKGPFNKCDKWWWRRGLDKMITDKNFESGFEYAKKKGKSVKKCQCVEGSHFGAGYYCMIRKQPVCEEHSRGGISWFPGGADLARISSSEYEKIGPFMGLY